MSGIDDIVRRLSELTDELLALQDDDFSTRFRLETERDELRAQAEEFHERKDEARSTEQLRDELKARRSQLQTLRWSMLNSASQASAASGRGGGSARPIGAKHGGTINNALMGAQGSHSIVARIAEIEQELARR